MPAFTYAYPEILTRRDWDKKKGVFAKLAGPTGVGNECERVLALYKNVNWIKLNPLERRDQALGKWNQDSFSKQNWDKLVHEAEAEIKGNLAKLSVECYKLRDLCRKVATDFKNSKTIPASAAQHAAAMATEADHMGVALNVNSMGTVLQKMTQAFLADVNTKFISMMKTGARNAASKHQGTLAALQKNPTAAFFNTTSYSAARDLAQNLGNLHKAYEKGFMPQDARAQQLFVALTPYANAKQGVVPGNATPDQVKNEIQKFAKIFTPALQYSASVR